MDFRSKVVGSESGRKLQQFAFTKQLELALTQKKVPVLHIVRALDMALPFLQKFTASGGRAALVHAFSGDWSAARKLLDLGYYLSLGGAVTHSHFLPLREAVKKMPLNQILLESDSPDQAPIGWDSEVNEPCTVRLVAEAVSEVKGLALDELKQACWNNFFQLFDREFYEPRNRTL